MFRLPILSLTLSYDRLIGQDNRLECIAKRFESGLTPVIKEQMPMEKISLWPKLLEFNQDYPARVDHLRCLPTAKI